MAESITGSYSWQSKVENLKTSDDDIFKIVQGVMERGSPQERFAFQYALENRKSTTEFLSNVLSALAQTARGVIANMRG
jgi:uncharacterized protein YukJ